MFCTKCGGKNPIDAKFCMHCSKPISNIQQPTGYNPAEKIINIPLALLEQCLMDNFKYHQERLAEHKALYSYAPFRVAPANIQKCHSWIQFDPTTGRYSKLVVPVSFKDARSLPEENMSGLHQGWNYCMVATPEEAWQIRAYLADPRQMGMGPDSVGMGGFTIKFVE